MKNDEQEKSDELELDVVRIEHEWQKDFRAISAGLVSGGLQCSTDALKKVAAIAADIADDMARVRKTREVKDDLETLRIGSDGKSEGQRIAIAALSAITPSSEILSLTVGLGRDASSEPAAYVRVTVQDFAVAYQQWREMRVGVRTRIHDALESFGRRVYVSFITESEAKEGYR